METEIGKLTAVRRVKTGKGNARKLRRDGKIPAVLYGEGGASENITLDPTVMLKAMDPGKGGNTVFELVVEDGAEKVTHKVMLKDYQRDTLKGDWLHVDFIRVSDDTVVRVDVPLVTQGTAPGIKLGGKLYQVFRKLPILCVTSAIPSKIEIDINSLNVGDSLAVKDLIVPEGSKVALPDNQTVVSVLIPRGMKDEDEADEGEEGEEGEEAAAADEGDE
ncbi:MAG: 50S ribosomal protein L25 [Proteobacteria bacterium]|nr:MAG: 50S ribosomal protein L25 [Pseudomonadota bacterium]PIE17701.1 MAG: 50S ribosomal protein L25 [Pseudomonadota bacterium]